MSTADFLFGLQQQEIQEKVLKKPRWWSQGLREGFKWLDVLQGASSPSGGCVSGSRARGSFLPRAFIWVGAAREGRVLKSGQPAMNYGLCPGT